MTKKEMNAMFTTERTRIEKAEAKRTQEKNAPAKKAHLEMIAKMNAYRAANFNK